MGGRLNVAPPGHDSVLLLAFGGPTRPGEIRAFLDNVLRGKPVSPERYEEVVRHYEEVGGVSPINRLTFAQAAALRDRLAKEGPPLPVYVGMRHGEPYIAETLAAMAREGRRRTVGLVLAAHRSMASWEAYLRAVADARKELGGAAPPVDYVAAWSDHPLFIEAVAARTSETLQAVPAGRRDTAVVVFTAHSLPVEMSRQSSYAEGVERTARLTGERLGIGSWSLAYTSRSGSPADPWLEPDINVALRVIKTCGGRDVVVSPIGFVSDHVEVLYDLDIGARRTAEELGLGFFRAGTAGDHPAFTGMMAALVRDMAAGA